MSRWTEAVLSAWGKFDRETGDAQTLVQHLTDTAHIAGLLWDHWLPQAVKALIERSLPPGARDGRTLFCWLAGVHDLGKLTPAFAYQVWSLAENMNRAGLTMPTSVSDAGRAPHGLTGQAALQQWLREQYAFTPVRALKLSDVVGAHHGRPVQMTGIQDVLARGDHYLGGQAWHEARLEVLETMAAATGADQHLAAWAEVDIETTALVALSGAVIVADWLASNVDLFPYISTPTFDPARAESAWAQVGLLPPWPGGELYPQLAERFPHLGATTPRPIQAACVTAAAEASGPTMIIVEAPMGGGKTEAALLAAESLATRTGAGGVIVALPTMATSDAMFGRVARWLDHIPGGGKSTFLAHGKADLNEEFSILKRAGRGMAATYDDERDGHASEPDIDGAVATAVSWLSGRKKGVLANFVVGTIDQVLFMALSAKHVALRHLALAGKVIVLDEVHAADDYMRVYLTRALEWLGSYGCSVVMLSATLPSTHRAELVEAYQRGLGTGTNSLDPTQAYPALTAVDSHGVRTLPIHDSRPTTTLSIENLGEAEGSLVEHLTERLRDGGCAAVIRNTVSRAQSTFRELRQQFGDDVVLVHSRFLAVERAALEHRLRNALGPDSARPERLIVVGTQVLEQSLDIDFDLMISDIAPADLLLQRAGRLHRHDRSHRPVPLSTPRMLITGITEWTSQGPRFDRGIEAVYPRAALLRTVAALGLGPSGLVQVDVPTRIRDLVEATYVGEPVVPTSWAQRTAEAQRKWSDTLLLKRDKAKDFAIDRPPTPDAFGAWFAHFLLPGPDDVESSSSGSGVRDGEDGFEVALVQRIGNEVRLLPGTWPQAGSLLPVDLGPPDTRLALAIVRSCVRLPIQMTSGATGDAVLSALEAQGFETWQQSGWLKGLLTLVLDEHLTATVAGFEVAYSPTLGLLCERSPQ